MTDSQVKTLRLVLLALFLCGCAPRHVREARPTPVWVEGGKTCNMPGWYYDYETHRCERSK